MGRLEELEDRLTTLEDAVCYKLDAGAFEKLSRRVCALEAKEYNLDREVLRQPITAKDIDRWREMERCLKWFFCALDANKEELSWVEEGPLLFALRAALEGK